MILPQIWFISPSFISSRVEEGLMLIAGGLRCGIHRTYIRGALNLYSIVLEPMFEAPRAYVRLPSSLCSIILEPKYSDTNNYINK